MEQRSCTSVWHAVFSLHFIPHTRSVREKLHTKTQYPTQGMDVYVRLFFV
jgi:hypothetical protein